jgi:hypothetical protein
MKKKWLTGHSYGDDLKKLIRIMRLTILLLFGCMVTVSANSYAQKTRLDVNMTNTSIRDLFGFIEENSEFVFLYRNEDFNVSKKVEIVLKDATINQILDEALKGENVMYHVYERQIVIQKTSDVLSMVQQSSAISGTVKDSKGLPIPGVSVLVKNSSIGTITDSDGSFKLSVPTSSQLLVFSFVGMQSQEVEIQGKTTFNIVLLEETIGVDEVVVVGYGVQKKANLTGAVDQVTSDVFENRTMTNLSQGLKGVMPNLNIKMLDGKPNQAPSYNIRGTTSIGQGGSALILIDGVEGDPSLLNPNDIASVSMLKDAASASIY